MGALEHWVAFNKWWRAEQHPQSIKSLEPFFTNNPIFSTSMSLNRSLTLLVDLRTMQIPFCVGDVNALTGWDDTTLKGGVQYIHYRVHPDDQAFGPIVGKLASEYYKSLTESDRKNYKCFWDFRFLKPNGESVRVLAQDIVLEHDAHGNMVLLMSLIVEVEAMKSDRANHLRLTDGEHNKLFEFNQLEQKIQLLGVPTQRELEVFKLISQGFDRSQVAKKMKISLATVKSHCEHVYKKLNTKDSIETINLLQLVSLL